MSTFTSDCDEAVHALVASCAKPRASLEQPSLPHLIGRELQPFDFADAPAPLGRPSGSKRGSNGSPTSSAPRKSTERSHSGNGRRALQQQGPGKKQHSAKGTAASGSSDDEQHQSSRSRSNNHTSSASRTHPISISRNNNMAPPSTPPPMQLAFSCPGTFRNSPKPDALPLPTSALLLRAAQRTSSAVAVPAA